MKKIGLLAAVVAIGVSYAVVAAELSSQKTVAQQGQRKKGKRDARQAKDRLWLYDKGKRTYWWKDRHEAKLKEIIARIGASKPSDMGKVMGVATKALAGLAEGRTISAIVKKLLA